MTVEMKENLLVVGVQSYLKKLILMVVLQQESFQKFHPGCLIGLESSNPIGQRQIENES